ncbi:ArsR/SmtB family transcription factor [Williamsia sterculiae]|uniref:Transcriptional regulator, ArsR family n=1 Tax=Williamsia sterculiae TaxID=1344003 RepID=A0A1N7CEJ6_9NOCA|nr:helix-turn-helix domain-containing protein [Williamsia sterculiae]SIR61844.1 transcriptional regulator, ArsR family [Williamsia sterculiae]
MRTRLRGQIDHPSVEEIDLLDVLHALSDPTRMEIVLTLLEDVERPCGTFDVDVAPSTLTHHFRVLRESGVIRQREEGRRKWTTLRLDDLESRFPGVIPAITRAYHADIEKS